MVNRLSTVSTQESLHAVPTQTPWPKQLIEKTLCRALGKSIYTVSSVENQNMSQLLLTILSVLKYLRQNEKRPLCPEHQTTVGCFIKYHGTEMFKTLPARRCYSLQHCKHGHLLILGKSCLAFFFISSKTLHKGPCDLKLEFSPRRPCSQLKDFCCPISEKTGKWELECLISNSGSVIFWF